MARKKDLFINIILILFTLIFTAECSKLNVPRVLLPIFNDISTNFTLEVTEGGCYKWSTSRQDLVQIIPLNVDEGQECSTSVVVLAISKEPTRNTAIVLAEDLYTGQVLRCDVIVDVIASLHIVTTTRELFMEEAPEAFEVRGYDDQGNEFSTLEGVEFDWSLSSSTISEDNVVLRFITFGNSPYETPPSIDAFEEMGKQGHIVLLEGVKTGSAQISVRLPHPEYKHLDGIEVSLMVIANLIIEPPDIYILRGDVVHFKIIQVKHGRLEEINLPNSQYYLVAENPDIGHIEKKSGYLTGLNVGKSRVYLHDSNVKEDAGLKPPSATVYVTYPDRIVLTLLPHRNWATIIGQKHDIAVELYTDNDHKIHIGEGVTVNINIDENFFSPTFRSANGTFISGKTIQQGPTEVFATLVSVISQKLGAVNLEPQLTTRAEMLIHNAIILNPSEIILPWDPKVKPKYDVDLRVGGGDGKFLWSTSNHSIGVVTQTGLVRTHFHGQFDTCACMLRNHHNRQCSKFFILPPSKMEIVDFVMEDEIGAPIFLNIALYADRPKPGGTTVLTPFSKCDEIPFVVKTSDNNFYYDEKAVGSLVGISCTSLGIIGLAVGTVRVTVQYKQDEINLEQTVTVAAYRPLKLLHPCCSETVLALGTSRYLIFTGGPRPWSGRPSEHVVKIISSDPTLLDVEDSTQEFKVPGGSDTYVIKVTCKDIGEASVKLSIFNKPLLPKCLYKESIATATVFCAIPEYIILQPEIKVSDSSNCPMDLNAERVIVQNYQQTDLLVIVKDRNGRRFDNISSLEFQWNSKPSELAMLTHKNGTFEKIYFEENVCLPNKSYQTIEPQNQVGVVEIEAAIVGYKQAVLKKNKVTSSPKLDLCEAKISLYLVDDTFVVPNRTLIYNHPLNKVSLSVKEGSGYNEITLSTRDIADVKYNEGLRQIEVTPKQAGEVQITVRDLCLQCPPVNIVLNIVYVASVRVEMADRVEIGKCIPVIIKFYDEFDNLMPLPKLEYLDVRFSIADDDIVNMKIANPNTQPWGVGEMHYVLQGLQLGETKIMFASGRGPKEVISLPVNIQVFSPLKINPRNATLLVGSVMQFSTEGGPQPDTNTEYTIDFQKPNTANVSLNGILHAENIGYAKITGRSVSIDPITGKKVTNSKDTVEVHVVSLVGIKLSAPLTRFVEGATVPIWATGLPEKLSSLLIGSVDPPFCYSWGTSCPDILSLNGIFYPFGVKDNPFNKVSVRAKGLRPGTCTVQLNITLPAHVTGAKRNTDVVFTSTIDMEVIESLYLAGPQGFNGKTILMAPFSTLKLKTNRDGYSVLQYSIHGEEQSDEGGNKKSISVSRHLIAISNDGVITSRDIPGRALVVITATDEHGLKQTLSLVVQIKLVHYMMLTVQADWMIPFDENIKVVPLGAQFKLITSYHDNTGAKFSAALCDINFRTSRQDLIEIKRSIDNTTFTAFTMKEGSTVVKVWADNCFKTADYVQILTGQVSLPKTESVTCGDVLCMYSSVTDKQGNHGEWSSEPEDIINVNSSSGIGQVVSPSSGKAYLKYDLTPSAQIGLDVEPISDISFVFDKKRVLTNAPGTIFKVHFLLKDAKHPDKTSNMHVAGNCNNELTNEITNFPFECVIDFVECDCNCLPNIWDVFEVYPAFNQDSGLYSCNIKPVLEVNANMSTIQSGVILKVIADNGVESSPLKLQFLPAIYVPSQDLLVDKKSYIAVLTVTGLPQVLKAVTVEPVDYKLIQVGKIKYPSEIQISYDVKIIDYHWKLEELHDPLSVIVNSKLTNQKIKVQIHLDESGAPPFCVANLGSPLGNFIAEYGQALVILISMLIILIVSFYIYSTYMQPVINVNVAAGRPCTGPCGPRCTAPCASMSPPCPVPCTMPCQRTQQHQCAANRAQQHQCAANRAQQHQCAANRTQTHQCAAFRAQTIQFAAQAHQCAALSLADRSMMLTPSQTILNTSQPRPLGCPPVGYSPRNLISGSPTMRYGPDDTQNRSCGSPELRRNRRFL